jgi:hypothetical protein
MILDRRRSELTSSLKPADTVVVVEQSDHSVTDESEASLGLAVVVAVSRLQGSRQQPRFLEGPAEDILDLIQDGFRDSVGHYERAVSMPRSNGEGWESELMVLSVWVNYAWLEFPGGEEKIYYSERWEPLFYYWRLHYPVR